MELTDDELINGCKADNRKIQEMLYRKYAGEMFRVCLSYEPDRDIAKDILQRAFLKVFRNIESYQGTGTLKGWIRRITTNTAIDLFRQKRNSFNTVSIDETDGYNEPAGDNSDPLFYKDLLKEVQNLPDGARMVFNLYALEGYGHKEIAEKLNVTEGTSKSQLSRARKILNERLKGMLE